VESRPRRILPVIVASQFAGTSLWFAGNAVIGDLQREWGLAPQALGYVTSAVQLGFICGTLVFAFFAIADRHSPRLVFFACALLGALANLALLAADGGLVPLLVLRFATGFFLAGIYPVGMKIAAGWYRSGLGHALGFLVGALVLGTAFPHLLRALGAAWPWQSVLAGVSAAAALGGVLMLALVPDGPHLVRGAPFDPRALAVIFRSRGFRASAFGYFGHMWELYAFWAFVPVALAARVPPQDVPAWSFAVIAAGALGCVAGGFASLRAGAVPRRAAVLGRGGRRRFAAVLRAQCGERPARARRLGADHRQLHRLRDYDREHPAAERPGGRGAGAVPVPAARARAAVRPARAAAAAAAGYWNGSARLTSSSSPGSLGLRGLPGWMTATWQLSAASTSSLKLPASGSLM
jgi:MFS family permease